MATVSVQSTRRSFAVVRYAEKDYVAISALGVSVQRFERHLYEIRVAHGKNGMRAQHRVDEDGKILRDSQGEPVIATDRNGSPVYEAKYIQAYSLVESFGRDELDPDDPESWTKAQEYGRALAADRAPGHPALIATEVNGRTGHVHNHIIIGAVHPVTGKSIDSNVFTHSRLAIAHDRVLADHGFTQREDMRQLTETAIAEVQRRRDQALADAPDGISPSQLERRLLAAENSVRFKGSAERAGLTTEQKAQHREHRLDERRQREFELYTLNEVERENSRELGLPMPAERFSETELRGRIEDVLSDSAVTSWDELAAVAEQHGIRVARRGKDMSYGMMLHQADGSLAEPARAHRRRGTSLGERFLLADVEAAIAHNAQQTSTQIGTPHTSSTRADSYDDILADLERVEANTLGQTQSAPSRRDEEPEKLAEPAQQTIELAPEPVAPPFQSGLRRVRVKSARQQRRIDALASLEEDYRERDFQPNAAFAARILDKDGVAGVSQQMLDKIGTRLDPRMRDVLSQYVAKQELGRQCWEKKSDLGDTIKARLGDGQGDFGDFAQRLAMDAEAHANAEMAQRLRREIAEGRFESDADEVAAEIARTIEERRQDHLSVFGQTGRDMRRMKLPQVKSAAPYAATRPKPIEAELLAVVTGRDDAGRAVVDVQLRGEDPYASSQPGLHLQLNKSGEEPSSPLTKYTESEVDAMKTMAGSKSAVVGGARVYAFRGTVEPQMRGSELNLRVRQGSLKPSSLSAPDSETLVRQSQHEDRVREQKAAEAAERLKAAKPQPRGPRKEVDQSYSPSM